MEISKAHLLAAAQRAGIAPDRAQALWEALGSVKPAAAKSLNATNVAYYFGGFLIVGAMTFFMAEGWVRLGPGFILTTAVAYAVLLAAVGWRLYRDPETRTPGGILVTAAVCMTPLAVYGLEKLSGAWAAGNPGPYSGFYSLVHESWIWMELGTIAASALALRFVRFPLLTLPAAVALWFLSMDCVSAIFGKDHDWNQMLWVSLIFGLAMLATSIAIDRRSKQDFAFWGYLYGTIAFYGGLGLLWTDEPHKLIFLLVSLATIVLSIVLGRRVLLIFGTLAVASYLAQLAFGIFKLSIVFPFALTAIGLGIVFAGIWYQRNESRVRARILAVVPARIIAMLPESRAV